MRAPAPPAPSPRRWRRCRTPARPWRRPGGTHRRRTPGSGRRHSRCSVSFGGGVGCSARARTIPPCHAGAPAEGRRTGGRFRLPRDPFSLTRVSMPCARRRRGPRPIRAIPALVRRRRGPARCSPTRWSWPPHARRPAVGSGGAAPGLDERGFAFYTNFESRKGRELDANPHAAIALPLARSAPAGPGDRPHRTCRPTPSPRRTGRNRPRASRVSAWASAQSEPIGLACELEAPCATWRRASATTTCPCPRSGVASGSCPTSSSSGSTATIGCTTGSSTGAPRRLAARPSPAVTDRASRRWSRTPRGDRAATATRSSAKTTPMVP